ncbi:MAG: glutamate racemase, partial [Candidatus Aegiribacteria sp.]|nr:glutamate racemase [Candidatus Aegiribacteria sp.]
VMGCTHYPLLRNALSKVLGVNIRLIDSAEATAGEVASALDAKGLRSDNLQGQNIFYVSDIPLKFQENAQRFLGKAIPLVTHIEVGDLH